MILEDVAFSSNIYSNFSNVVDIMQTYFEQTDPGSKVTASFP